MKESSDPNNKLLLQDYRAIALLMAASLTTMANATISPALAGLKIVFADHPHNDLLIPLLVSAPSLTVVLFAPLAGILIDWLGRRWLLLTGVLLFVMSGTAGFYLTDLEMVFGSRLILGLAVAMIMTSQTALVGDYFVGEKRTALTGLQISARNFGGFLFISLAGFLAVHSPRLPFAIYGLAAVFLPFMWFVVQEPHKTRYSSEKVNLTGEKGSPNWLSLTVLLTVLQMATNMLFFIMPTQLPFYLDALGYDSSVMTGIMLGALTLSGGFAALRYSRLKKFLGFRATFALAYGLMAVGYTLIPHGASVGLLVAGAVSIGVGFALAMPNFMMIALQLAPQERRGIVSGILTTGIFLGQFVSPMISTAAIAASGYESMFYGAALILAILSLAAAVIHGFSRCHATREAI